MYLDSPKRNSIRLVLAMIVVSVGFSLVAEYIGYDGRIESSLIGMATFLLGYAIGYVEPRR